MNLLMTLWKMVPWSPIFSPVTLLLASPVTSCRKFSTVRGTTDLYSSGILGFRRCEQTGYESDEIIDG